MTRKIEDVAKEYLKTNFKHSRYEFGDKQTTDKGFDLWLHDKDDDSRKKVELKAHSGAYRRPSNLFERLIFNADIERELFEKGETVIARVFLGEKPYRVFIITNGILATGAKLETEARYVIKGKINYDNSYTELA